MQWACLVTCGGCEGSWPQPPAVAVNCGCRLAVAVSHLLLVIGSRALGMAAVLPYCRTFEGTDSVSIGTSDSRLGYLLSALAK